MTKPEAVVFLEWVHKNCVRHISDDTYLYLDEAIWYNIEQLYYVFKKIEENKMLIDLMWQRGIKVFGSEEDFKKWLNSEGLFLDGRYSFKYLRNDLHIIEAKISAIENGKKH